MASDVSIERLPADRVPRELLNAHFRTIPDLPISGGWGYANEDAVIINRNDPIVPKGAPFNGVSIEYEFVKFRLYEEMIIFQPRGKKYAGIEWKLITQQLVPGHAGRTFDVLRFKITALPEQDWNALKQAWEGPDGISSPSFDENAHRQRHEAAIVTREVEYWFEISSFFGRHD